MAKHAGKEPRTMMRRKLLSRLTETLDDAISNCLCDEIDSEDLPVQDFPHFGPNTTLLMAEAAVAVLNAVYDSQIDLIAEGMLDAKLALLPEPAKADKETIAPVAKRPFWLSWLHGPDDGGFELHTPWWASGDHGDWGITVCAAVMAADESEAKSLIKESYDNPPAVRTWRFCDAQEPDWAPFSERFEKADWMKW